MGKHSERVLGLAIVGLLALGAAACSGSSEGSDGAASDDGGGAKATTTTTSAVAPDDDLRLNQIQVIGTHNSFHQAAPGDEYQQLAALNAEQAAQRTYTHPDLTTQLDEQKVRQLELDVFADAKGGLYSSPALRDPGASLGGADMRSCGHAPEDGGRSRQPLSGPGRASREPVPGGCGRGGRQRLRPTTSMGSMASASSKPSTWA